MFAHVRDCMALKSGRVRRPVPVTREMKSPAGISGSRPRPTQSMIAGRLGLSVTTVSNALGSKSRAFAIGLVLFGLAMVAAGLWSHRHWGQERLGRCGGSALG